jgi:hypothetical protein
MIDDSETDDVISITYFTQNRIKDIQYLSAWSILEEDSTGYFKISLLINNLS